MFDKSWYLPAKHVIYEYKTQTSTVVNLISLPASISTHRVYIVYGLFTLYEFMIFSQFIISMMKYYVNPDQLASLEAS